ncbi:uncharacterized protein C1orf167 homolog isoform X2 [Rattus norvegicus]|uniref:uncharacterized protein C1orf167 homolog isoform X2 n=1 Tax=Rattus norvegicus TaxID=10116 RepID=UPI0004E47CD5|nr:uncharacterized protein C1orf167 homolog isoform X2 [Rattus norvegicus]|eukprot:XP_008762537.1 PREDICTED: uncharacterized protein C1orf167 homolog isoform X2 [Rattus norvegicus]
MPMGQVTTHSQDSVLCQKPYQVQSNLASPRPRLALALKDTAGRLGDTGLWQQSNLQLPTGRSQGRTREPSVQQSNLCFRGTTSPHLQNSCLPPTGPSSHQKQTLQVADTFLSLPGGLAPLDGCTWPGPRSWCGSGSWAPRLVGEPLTLEDLSISAHSQSQASSPSSCSTADWLLDSIQHLEPEATSLGNQISWEHPGLTQSGPHTRGNQSTPAQPWPSHSRECISFLETLGVQARLSESPIYKPLSRETTLGTLAGVLSDSDQEVLPTRHLGTRERGPRGFLCNKRHRGHFSVTLEAGSKETRLESTRVFSVQPGKAGREKTPQGQTGRDGERTASCLSNTAPAHSTLQDKAQSTVTLDSQAACWKLLSKSFRVWRYLSQRLQAVAKATAMRHRQLIGESPRELRWAPWLQETRLEAAWGQHAKALLAWSFREQKLEQAHTQAAPTFLAPRGSLSLERKAATDLAWRCRDKCFRAWLRFVQRGAQCRRHLAHRRVRTLRVCLGRWVEMKLQGSDVTEVTQLALYWQKAGNEVLSSLVPGTSMVPGLETEAQVQQPYKGPDLCSLWEMCQKLALYRALLLWRTRLYQHQQAVSSFQGMQKRVLQHILSQWHLRVWGPDPPSSDMKARLPLEAQGSSPRWEAWLDCRTSGGALEKRSPQLEPLDCSSRSLGRPSCSLSLDQSVGAVMGLCRQRLTHSWTVQESPGARPGTGASGPEPPALLLTEGAKDWAGTPGRGEGQGSLVTL